MKKEDEIDTKTSTMDFDKAMDLSDKEVTVNGKALDVAIKTIIENDEIIKDNYKDLSIYEKLGIIQTELIAPKGQFNKHGNYKYRSCEDIVEAVKPMLRDFSLILLITDKIEMSDILETEIVVVNKKATEVQTLKTYIKATAKLIDFKGNEISVDGYARESSMKTGMASSQLTGATSSYARKYALNGLFAIDDTKDADTMDNSSNSNNPPAPKLITIEQYNQIMNVINAKNMDESITAQQWGMKNIHELQAQNFNNFFEWVKAQ